eukprot:m.102368 g.102368  ORF g.102368 m.102368 type:complete len:660 (+) comp14117_c0_seq1:212-2191(+)
MFRVRNGLRILAFVAVAALLALSVHWSWRSTAETLTAEKESLNEAVKAVRTELSEQVEGLKDENAALTEHVHSLESKLQAAQEELDQHKATVQGKDIELKEKISLLDKCEADRRQATGQHKESSDLAHSLSDRLALLNISLANITAAFANCSNRTLGLPPPDDTLKDAFDELLGQLERAVRGWEASRTAQGALQEQVDELQQVVLALSQRPQHPPEMPAINPGPASHAQHGAADGAWARIDVRAVPGVRAPGAAEDRHVETRASNIPHTTTATRARVDGKEIGGEIDAGKRQVEEAALHREPPQQSQGKQQEAAAGARPPDVQGLDGERVAAGRMAQREMLAEQEAMRQQGAAGGGGAGVGGVRGGAGVNGAGGGDARVVGVNGVGGAVGVGGPVGDRGQSDVGQPGVNQRRKRDIGQEKKADDDDNTNKNKQSNVNDHINNQAVGQGGHGIVQFIDDLKTDPSSPQHDAQASLSPTAGVDGAAAAGGADGAAGVTVETAAAVKSTPAAPDASVGHAQGDAGDAQAAAAPTAAGGAGRVDGEHTTGVPEPSPTANGAAAVTGMSPSVTDPAATAATGAVVAEDTAAAGAEAAGGAGVQSQQPIPSATSEHTAAAVVDNAAVAGEAAPDGNAARANAGGEVGDALPGAGPADHREAPAMA